MPINQPSYPDINGKRYQFASIQFFFPNYPGQIFGLQAIDYDETMEIGELRGTSPDLLGQTTGKSSFKGTLTLPKVESDNLLVAIESAATASPDPLTGNIQGYLQFVTPVVTISYQDYNQPFIFDQIFGLRLIKSADTHKTGQEALYVKYDWMAYMVSRNTKYPDNPGIQSLQFGQQ